MARGLGEADLNLMLPFADFDALELLDFRNFEAADVMKEEALRFVPELLRDAGVTGREVAVVPDCCA
jgi:hypothetical protein